MFNALRSTQGIGLSKDWTDRECQFFYFQELVVLGFVHFFFNEGEFVFGDELSASESGEGVGLSMNCGDIAMG